MQSQRRLGKNKSATRLIGGCITGTAANATRIDMPSPGLLRKVIMAGIGFVSGAILGSMFPRLFGFIFVFFRSHVGFPARPARVCLS
jgi:hypothetical protein